jgi:chemotaxis protein CheD
MKEMGRYNPVKGDHMITTIGIGEMGVSGKAGDILITYSLGTCLGMTIYDPVAKVGGMIHSQLPLSSVNPAKAGDFPARFIDVGIPALFEKAYKLGAQKKRVIIKIAGCNTDSDENKVFRIGERNQIMIRKLLWKNNLFISGEDVGGSFSRTLSLEISTGIVHVKTGLNSIQL